jgi:hypothetical protein
VSERIKITVKPSGAHPNVLAIQDAMQQVLDFFVLVGTDRSDGDAVVWNLVAASTNSPFTAEAEAVSLVPDVNVDVVARRQKTALARHLRALANGDVPADWQSPERARIAKRILERNRNGVGETDIHLDQAPIVITPKIAERAIGALAKIADSEGLLEGDRSRDEIGSVEGRLIGVGTDYNQPAIRIEERKSGAEVWCRVPLDVRDRIANEANFVDVWEHRRVLIRGLIRYEKDGSIGRVYAQSVERLTPRQMTIHDIRDPDFTGGLSTADYLNKLREGELG